MPKAVREAAAVVEEVEEVAAVVVVEEVEAVVAAAWCHLATWSAPGW